MIDSNERWCWRTPCSWLDDNTRGIEKHIHLCSAVPCTFVHSHSYRKSPVDTEANLFPYVSKTRSRRVQKLRGQTSVTFALAVPFQ